MNEDVRSLDDFTGTARLFPLPGLVFFPQAVQPLHIFEPRYRQMLADALATDRLLAMVLLRPNWEKNYEQRPAIEQVACLGRVVAEQLLPDGRSNLLLRGLARVRLLEEVPTDKLYRSAKVEVLQDIYSPNLETLLNLRARLTQEMLPFFSDSAIREQVRGLLTSEMPLGQICDMLAFSLPLTPVVKQQLLAETRVETRVELLLAGFLGLVAKQAEPTTTSKFPPDFSEN